MHISEGVLSAPVLAAGWALATGGVAIGVKKLEPEELPKAAMLSSAFFVASLIHVPVPPSSAHLILNGVCGLLLGWPAFPAILVALFLQAVLFGFGGITTLGVNTIIMALPAVLVHYAFSRAVHSQNWKVAAVAAYASGALPILLSCLLARGFLVWAKEQYEIFAGLLVLVHLPIVVIEGIIVRSIVGFLRTVSPEMLEVGHAKS